MTVTAGAKGRVFCLASRVELHSDARPVVDGVAQADVGGLAHEHDAALAGSLGHRGDAGQAAQRVVVSAAQSLGSFCEQRGEDDPADARQGSQDRHVALLGFVLPVIAGKRGAQSVEAALRVADLAVDEQLDRLTESLAGAQESAK